MCDRIELIFRGDIITRHEFCDLTVCVHTLRPPQKLAVFIGYLFQMSPFIVLFLQFASGRVFRLGKPSCKVVIPIAGRICVIPQSLSNTCNAIETVILVMDDLFIIMIPDVLQQTFLCTRIAVSPVGKDCFSASWLFLSLDDTPEFIIVVACRNPSRDLARHQLSVRIVLSCDSSVVGIGKTDTVAGIVVFHAHAGFVVIADLGVFQRPVGIICVIDRYLRRIRAFHRPTRHIDGLGSGLRRQI